MSIIGTFPTTITNGQVEDATVVMSLFSWIQAQTNGNACPATVGTLMLKGDGFGGTIGATDGTDFLSPTTMAASGGSLLVGHLPFGVGAVATTVQAYLRNLQGWTLNVMDAPFYAKGDNVTNDRAAIQAAIDYANSLGVPTRVLVPSGYTFRTGVGAYTGIAAGVVGLVLKDNVTLVVDGTIKALSGIYGAGTLSALVKSLDTGLTNARITGTGTIDGNNISTTFGTAGNTTIGSPIITFTASATPVVGQYIHDAGNYLGTLFPLGTTILSIQSGTQVTLSANALATTSGKTFVQSTQLPSQQCDNVYLRAIYQVMVDGIKSVNANGNGILITKVNAGANHVDTAILATTVANCTSIGIQCSHSAANLIISHNRVTSCENNCIDVYDENGTVTPDPGIISIIGNAVAGGLVGIFPETTANCSVVGNTIGSCAYAGISTNRVNGAPSNIVISGNNIWGSPNGIIGSGDTGGVLITGNTVAAFTATGILLTGITVSSYTVHGNTFIPAATTTPVISLNGTTFVWNQIFNNVCEDASHDVTKGIVLVAGTIGANTIEPIIYSVSIRPVKNWGSGNSTSGGSSGITVPASTAGKLIIKSGAGGAWNSVWSGSFVSDATQVKVAQESSTFTAPGNDVASVTVTGASLVITVNWTASGSAGNYNYWIEYF